MTSKNLPKHGADGDDKDILDEIKKSEAISP